MATTPKFGLVTTDGVEANWILKDYQEAISLLKEEDMPFDNLLVQAHDRKEVRVLKHSAVLKELAEGTRPDYQDIDYYKYNIPVKIYGHATGVTREFIEDSSKKEVQMRLADATRAARKHRVNLIVTAMKQGIATADKFGWYGPLTCAADYNASVDLNVPDDYGANTWANVAAHMVTNGNYNSTVAGHVYKTGNAKLRLIDLTAGKKHIREHGHAPKLMFINSAQEQELLDLAGWTTTMTPVSIHEKVAVGGEIGRMLGLDIIVNDYIPAQYFVIVDNESKPIAGVVVRPITVEPGLGEYGLIESYLSVRYMFKVIHPGAGVYINIAT